MKSVGIIAEYNPFHNGHLYHINEIKKQNKDAVIVLVMTGNYTQRGTVAIIDKWKRSKIALKAGIDLVIELPFPFATQSADYFSYGAITLLENLKVQKLVFGSESDDISILDTIADCQLNNDEFDKLVKIYSKMGYNYPTSLSLSINDLTGKKIKAPNDLLGISYVKTIKKYNYKITPQTIKRTNDYHNKELEKEISSATAIRESLKNKQNIKGQVPDFTLDYLKNLHFIDDYFKYLKYKIITEKNLTIYNMVDEGIAKNLKKYINDSYTIDDLIKKIKSKHYTYNKISRMLLHILCNFTKEENNSFKQITYARILGFNENGRKYLNSIKKDIEIPIISKICKNKDPMLSFEIETTKIYALPLEPLEQKKLIESEYKNNLNKGE